MAGCRPLFSVVGLRSLSTGSHHRKRTPLATLSNRASENCPRIVQLLMDVVRMRPRHHVGRQETWTPCTVGRQHKLYACHTVTLTAQ